MSANSEARALPSGRHGLTREQVITSQRGRMLAALVSAVAEKGYAATTVADVLSRAGVSRQTFYEQFDNKEACFAAAFQSRVEELAAALRAAVDPADPPLRGLDRMLAAYLAFLAADPAYARTFLVEIYAAGPAMLAQRLAVHQRFVDVVTTIVDPTASPEIRLRCEALVGAISSMVITRVSTDAYAELEPLHPLFVQLATQLLGSS